MRKLGVPYEPGYESISLQDLDIQANRIASNLASELDGIEEVLPDLEIVALIAYLQRLGTDIKGNPTASIDAQTIRKWFVRSGMKRCGIRVNIRKPGSSSMITHFYGAPNVLVRTCIGWEGSTLIPGIINTCLIPPVCLRDRSCPLIESIPKF